VTARIFVRYRRPVHINRPLVARAWLTSAVGRRIHVDGELRDGDEVLAEARCAFLHVPLDHFLQTPEGRAAADAWRARLGWSSSRKDARRRSTTSATAAC
jgi:acyl-CoA thioesterase FadM